MEFLCSGLRPIIDGKIKPDQLRLLLDAEIERRETDNYGPVNVLTKVGDSMPGFGIVAAVMGIVVTMASINGPIEQIGENVAAALVGTFLGILLAYGFVNPLAMNLEFAAAPSWISRAASPRASSALPAAWRRSRRWNWAAAA